MLRFAPLALVASLGGLSLSACATMGAPMLDMTPEAAPAYVSMAASSDLFEIQTSQLALQRARDPMHRMHAQMMIRDHSNTTAQLKAAAAQAGLGVPMAMLPMHAAMYNELARSANFDAVYHRQQLVSHEQALALHGNFARNGNSPPLRAVAEAAVPVVQGHLNHLRSMSR